MKKKNKKPKEPDEIIIMRTTKKSMNHDIRSFREAYPDYQILNIAMYGGGDYSARYNVIWIRRVN